MLTNSQKSNMSQYLSRICTSAEVFRRRVLNISILLALLFLTACVPPKNSIPVLAKPDGIALLAGEWEGEYASLTTDRSGYIFFSLIASTDTASGEIIMTAGNTLRTAIPAYMNSHVPPISRFQPQALKVKFVQVAGNRISGVMSPYRDPDCGCTLTTTFYGKLEGDTITGEYVSRAAQSEKVQKGHWKVIRTKS